MPNEGAEFPVRIYQQGGKWMIELPDAPYIFEAYRGDTIPIAQVFENQAKFVNMSVEGVQDFVDVLGKYLTNIEQDLRDEQGGGGELKGFEVQTQGIGLGGGGGSGPPPEDPIVSKAKSFYRELWGIEPPKGYVEKFFNGGGDYFDFTRQEFGRPGAENSPLYRNQATGFAAAVSDIFGRGF